MTPGDATSPEELIAAAHSACYAMQLSALIGQAGGTPQALDVQADVSLGPDPAGGFRLTGIKLTVRGEVEGLDAEQFAKAAADAKAGLPGQQGADRRRHHPGRHAGELESQAAVAPRRARHERDPGRSGAHARFLTAVPWAGRRPAPPAGR